MKLVLAACRVPLARGAGTAFRASEALAIEEAAMLRACEFSQAARVCVALMSDSAGIPSPSCKRQIILRVKGRLRLSTSCTRLRLPMKGMRSEEHTSELQSRGHLVCRLLLEKK